VQKDMLGKSCVEVLFFGTRFSFFYAIIVAGMTVVVGIEAVLLVVCVS
jgi:ABC-type dipeptide/oligopeptide/nickel transport system permease subunit